MYSFFLRCKLIWQNAPGATLLLIFSFAAGCFCMNVFAGFGETDYSYERDNSINSTIIIEPEGIARSCDFFALLSEKGLRISEIIYKSQVEKYHYVLGWTGNNDCTLWFPHVGGRFFTKEELNSDDETVYLSNTLYSELEGALQYRTDGFEYKVIGNGWIIRYTFGMESLPGEDPDVEILPYKTFLKRMCPVGTVYIHVLGYTTEEIKGIAEEIRKMFPESRVLTSSFDSEKYRVKRISELSVFGALFAVLVWASLSSSFSLWTERNKKTNRVLKICGTSVLSSCIQQLMILLLLIILGESLAVILQWIMLPFLSYLRVERLPSVSFLLLSTSILFICVSLANISSIRRAAMKFRE